MEYRIPHITCRKKAGLVLSTLAPLCLMCSLFGIGLKEGPTPDLTSFLLIPCAFAYYWATFLCSKLQPMSIPAKGITLAGGCVFTIMLTENIFRKLLWPYYLSWCDTLGNYGAALVLVAAAVACAGVLGLILKRIPYVEKLL